MSLTLGTHVRQPKIKVLYGNCNPKLARDVCSILGVEALPSKVGRFANGEIQIQLHELVRGEDCFIVQPTCNGMGEDGVSVNVNQSTMELLLLIHTLRLSSAKRITAVVPHFGYARQDRKTQSRVPISASAIAKMITCLGVDRVITVDLHCGQIQGFFENIPVFDISSAQPFAEYIFTKNFDPESLIIVAPDAGAVPRAKKLADAIKASRIVTILKRRLCANQVESMQLVGDVTGGVCIIVDDMIDTAGTLCKAASVLVEWGAKEVHAYATHGIFTDPASTRLNECSALVEIVVTDTIVQTRMAEKIPKLKVLSAAPAVAEAIRRIHTEESFDDFKVRPQPGAETTDEGKSIRK